MMEKKHIIKPNYFNICNKILPLNYGFGIDYGIGQKYLPIWVSVSVSDLNQNSGFGRTLIHSPYHCYSTLMLLTLIGCQQLRKC